MNDVPELDSDARLRAELWEWRLRAESAEARLRELRGAVTVIMDQTISVSFARNVARAALDNDDVAAASPEETK